MEKIGNRFKQQVNQNLLTKEKSKFTDFVIEIEMNALLNLWIRATSVLQIRNLDCVTNFIYTLPCTFKCDNNSYTQNVSVAC